MHPANVRCAVGMITVCIRKGPPFQLHVNGLTNMVYLDNRIVKYWADKENLQT